MKQVIINKGLLFIMLITNNTKEDIINVIIKNVIAKVFTFSIDSAALVISSKFVLTV